MYHLGQTETFSVEEVLKKHSEVLDRLQKVSERDLFFRKIATGAAIAGALFAAIRLTDIWIAIKARRRKT